MGQLLEALAVLADCLDLVSSTHMVVNNCLKCQSQESQDLLLHICVDTILIHIKPGKYFKRARTNTMVCNKAMSRHKIISSQQSCFRTSLASETLFIHSLDILIDGDHLHTYGLGLTSVC